MSKINILDENLINLIAAGEVVERPASVLKELLENSIDASSTEIIVNLKDYGNTLIEVKDNGSGMTKEDAYLASIQHTTSKIVKPDDLNSINTLGFRGEALASIRAVAKKIILETKTANNDPVRLHINKDSIKEETASRSDKGTTISIFNLFENVPARKKFLKSETTELKNLINIFLSIALIRTDIHFEAYHNGKSLYKLTKTNDLRDRFFEIWGENLAKNVYPKASVSTDLGNIEAYLGAPETGKKSNPIQFMYINDRFITDKVIMGAINNAYSGFIHKDLKATYFISIHIDPTKVDVNVHPRKMEVKFSDPGAIYRLVYTSTRKWLEERTKESLLAKIKGEDLNKPTEYKSIQKDTPYFYPSEPRNNKSVNGSKVSEKKVSYAQNAFKNSSVKQALSFTEMLLQEPKEDTDLPIDLGHSIYQNQPLTQYFNTYITFSKNNSIVFIDQHAAAEKILFEKISKSLGKIKTKPLLVPDILELNALDKKILMDKVSDLQKVGLLVEDFGGNTIQITELPELIENFNAEEFINSIVHKDDETLINEYEKGTDQSNEISKEIYYLVATTACHGAIRAGQQLSESEMKQILSDLITLDNPYNCPHGRPVIWELSRSEVEKNFKRII
jgi:DNA mismatch repair protein MutL